MAQNLTSHASSRLRRRGFRERDVDLILEHGTPTCDGVLLTSRDVAKQVAEYRERIVTLERLQGAAVFLEEGQVVSVYRPCAAKVRRMIRHGRDRQTASRRGSWRGRPPG